MESLGVLDLSTPIPGSKVYIDGELLFKQNELLQMGTIRNKYNVACLNFTSAWDYNIYNWSWETIIENYMDRNGNFLLLSIKRYIYDNVTKKKNN